jgi:hypothetical protein
MKGKLSFLPTNFMKKYENGQYAYKFLGVNLNVIHYSGDFSLLA